MEYKITLLPKRDIIVCKKGQTLSDALALANYYLPAFCGGKGTCGKCKIKLLSGNVEGQIPDENGFILSCKAKIKEDITVYFNQQSGGGLTQFEEESVDSELLQAKKEGLGVALDIGTTTLAACLVHLSSGKTLKKISALNPQSVCGADVLSRINACTNGKLSLLQSLILDKTKELIRLLTNGEKVKELYVSANTTMLHLFLGVNPESIGKYPFTPVFTGSKTLFGKELGLPVERVCLLPSASAYVGSDITAGVLVLNQSDKTQTSILVDVGTNGEIVLAKNGVLYATSTAAGPALEGACIECGIGGVNGAIDRFFVKNGELTFSTIEDKKPVGICGSGLIDLIALLCSEDIIDETGAFNYDSESKFISKLNDDRFYVTEDIYLSQKDIRQFQLAKSAICAGIETMLIEKEVNISDIQNLYIAGGLGFYMNIENACNVGLLPKELQKVAKVVGNTSLAGVKLCLTEDSAFKTIQDIANDLQIVELSFSKVFQDKYVENMMF